MYIYIYIYICNLYNGKKQQPFQSNISAACLLQLHYFLCNEVLAEIFAYVRQGEREKFLKNAYPLLSKRVENVLLNW